MYIIIPLNLFWDLLSWNKMNCKLVVLLFVEWIIPLEKDSNLLFSHLSKGLLSFGIIRCVKESYCNRTESPCIPDCFEENIEIGHRFWYSCGELSGQAISNNRWFGKTNCLLSRRRIVVRTVCYNHFNLPTTPIMNNLLAFKFLNYFFFEK